MFMKNELQLSESAQDASCAPPSEARRKTPRPKTQSCRKQNRLLSAFSIYRSASSQKISAFIQLLPRPAFADLDAVSVMDCLAEETFDALDRLVHVELLSFSLELPHNNERVLLIAFTEKAAKCAIRSAI